jgi:hypothetical protein
MPFQEAGRLTPEGEREATMLVRPSTVPGAALRVIIDDQVFRAQIRAVSKFRENGKWRVWVRFE